MKIYVAGSFATQKGVKRVRELQNTLRGAEFEVLNHLRLSTIRELATSGVKWN